MMYHPNRQTFIHTVLMNETATIHSQPMDYLKWNSPFFSLSMKTVNCGFVCLPVNHAFIFLPAFLFIGIHIMHRKPPKWLKQLSVIRWQYKTILPAYITVLQKKKNSLVMTNKWNYIKTDLEFHSKWIFFFSLS